MSNKEQVALELQYFTPDSMAEHVAENWTSWDAARQVWKDRVREVIQYVYATSTRETSNQKNPWSHSTHIPKLTQIYDNLGANYYDSLFSRRDFFTFHPGNPDDDTKQKANSVKGYLDVKHRAGNFFPAMRELLDDFRLYGNSFVQVVYVREVEEDRQGNPIITYEGPQLQRISPWDIVFDHTAVSFDAAPKITRSLVSRAALLDDEKKVLGFEIDPEVKEKLREFSTWVGRQDSSELDKNIQRRYDGFTNASDYFKSGKVEVLEFYGDIFDATEGEHLVDQRVIVIDRRWVARMDSMEDLGNVGQIYKAGWRDRPDNLWSMGPLENLVGMQYMIDHLENARADAFDQMISPDRVITGHAQVEENGASLTYYIDDGNGNVQNLAPDPTVLRADFQIQTKENQMEVYAGAPREAMGLRSPGEKTAFEVQQLSNAANQIFLHKIQKFEEELVEPILNAELELAVRNLSANDVAQVMDDDIGVQQFVSVSKDDLTVRGKLRAQGSKHFERRARLVQELSQFDAIIAQDPEMKIHFPAKRRAQLWVELLDLENSDLFVPYGGIDEQLEMQKQMQAASVASDESTAASQALVEADPNDADLPEEGPQR